MLLFTTFKEFGDDLIFILSMVERKLDFLISSPKASDKSFHNLAPSSLI
ncbi:hypothetical protein BFG60_2554 [Microcystis aeruginosa NIES-98]|nr:hypothetical protein BFG60_2554 [Microcystis aeruginosa NIES-98]